MKLKGKIDMMAFLKELKKCTGEVFFETGTLRFEYESDIALLLPWIEEI